MKKTIRKTIALVIAASVMTVMAACSPKAEENNAPQLISGGTAATVASKGTDVKESAAPAATSDVYGLTYKGVLVYPGKALRSTQDGSLERIAFVHQFGDGIVDLIVRRIFDHLDLFQDDLTFFIQFLRIKL